ncbi:hypothetical protein HPB48_017612 [Haemaphysalis longicornis]|uniref:Uncharacterized protein n=1 Tax=Haemaphysalis longicornis TaxID=44386 RepID=A0A9J6H021_HAELO|nr:hypothetical protein HPB48_017612 [Haemaphysalis longicornis]
MSWKHQSPGSSQSPRPASEHAHRRKQKKSPSPSSQPTPAAQSSSVTQNRPYATTGTNAVAAIAARILSNAPGSTTRPLRLQWFPAHEEQAPGVDRARNRNITADRAARELTSRAAPQERSPPTPLNPGRRSHEDVPYSLPTPLEDYGTILRWYRDTRRRFPAPHPNLTRSEGTLYRQMQTDSVLTPVLGRHIAPAIYETSECIVCRATRGTLAHILQCAPQDPAPSSIRQLPVTVRRAITSSDYNTQKLVVQCVREALERQRVGGASPLGPSAGRLT